MEAHRTLDCRGDLCPMPVIKAEMAMRELQSGQVLLIEATDPGSKYDFPGWCHQKGHKILETKEDNKSFAFWIQKA